MGLQAIEAAPNDGNPVFLVDQHTGDTVTTHWPMLQGVSSQREGASIAFSRPISGRSSNWLPRSKTFEGSRRTSRVIARASVALAVCILWLFIEAAGDNGLCGESNTRTQSFAAPTEMKR